MIQFTDDILVIAERKGLKLNIHNNKLNIHKIHAFKHVCRCQLMFVCLYSLVGLKVSFYKISGSHN